MTDEPVWAVDTSVAVPLVMAAHEAHAVVRSWARGRRLALSGHALPETYAVLTRLPGEARVSPSDAVRLIDDNFPDHLPLPPASATHIHELLAGYGISGGAVYDAMVAMAAHAHGATLVTRDARARGTYEAVSATVHVLTGLE